MEIDEGVIRLGLRPDDNTLLDLHDSSEDAQPH